jgi:hypothetical protein
LIERRIIKSISGPIYPFIPTGKLRIEYTNATLVENFRLSPQVSESLSGYNCIDDVRLKHRLLSMDSKFTSGILMNL